MSIAKAIAIKLRQVCWHDPFCKDFALHDSDLDSVPLFPDPHWSAGYQRGYDDGLQHARVFGGILLRGWTCTACRRFNGEEKEQRYECSACGLESVTQG